MKLEEGALCTVEGCENPGLLGETRRIDGLMTVIVWCGPHLRERHDALEPSKGRNTS